MLGLTITEELYHRHPDRSEGDLAKLRASIVNTQALADVGRRWPTMVSAPCYWARVRRTPAAPASRAFWPTASNHRLAQSISSTASTVIEVILRLFGALNDTAPTLARVWTEEQPAGADRRARHGRAVLCERRRGRTTTRSSPRPSS